MQAEPSVRLNVTVECAHCAPYPAGAFNDPLPELWDSWVAGLHRVEQALHAAAGCDQPVRLRIQRASEAAA